MSNQTMRDIIASVESGNVVPYLGSGALAGSTSIETGDPIPADSDSLILAMNDGKPMAPRLMYEFPRAAMDFELKRGRTAVNRFLDTLYGQTNWTRAHIHDWIGSIKPNYVIDINRDTQLQDTYAQTPHTLIRGISRVGGTDYRFQIHHHDGKQYSDKEIEQTEVDTRLPVLFKPMGSPLPDATYIASDADYVDYITELMGGLAIPDFLKSYRQGKQYLFIGLRMTRDTERMILSDMIYAADKPAGWALISKPNDKEKRFCEKKHIEIIEANVNEFLAATKQHEKLLLAESL
ncbi:MAG: SIR2 family protein [gamma proteobacterium symbiont of Bathyaustriella thionipta]|nr:SIR2 family protein [gamma proteobacterium symbiont of Bathyaustriella thionipta]MCU7949472.1 SIR2 family protein [gamma proteobacterium symbiont of Bathyaustriella thionipta]MCU7953580.1 SIR2 family protein [gamma proteobacterium symbiont of Bathyaustriella thionipta]MCU7955936.1 SIR2 family protein [gamma proteobacterium symbiont of Bathyaustriella thionipta]MCU7968553.1 SIR2 family protein [gamma proteobacterium symbiont of Bathyaustriella thionipta]